MKAKPMGLLLVMLAGWINRHQQDVIVYLKEENRILREKLGKKRVILNDNQRMRLARLGQRLGKKVLTDACRDTRDSHLFSPCLVFFASSHHQPHANTGLSANR